MIFAFLSVEAAPLFVQKALSSDKIQSDQKSATLADYVKSNPNDNKATLQLANHYYESANFKSVIQTVQTIPKSKLDSQAKLLLAKAYYNLGDFEALYTTYLSRVPFEQPLFEEEVSIIWAEALVFKDQLEEAKNIYQTCLKQNPVSTSAWIGLARLELKKYSTQEAKKHLSEAKRLAGDSIEIDFVTADIYRLEEDFESAKQYYEKVIQAKPYHVWARIHYAALMLSLNQNNDFYQQINWLIESAPSHPQTQFFQSVKALQGGDTQIAINTLSVLIKHFPNHTAALRLLARAYYSQGDLENANRFIQDSLSLYPEDRESLTLQAVIALKMNQPKRVIEILSPFVSDTTENERMLSLLGTAYMLSGEIDKGLLYLNKAEKINTNKSNKTMAADFSEPQSFELVSDQLKKGVIKEANKDYTIAKIESIRSHLNQKSYEEAQKLSLLLVKDNPDNPVAYDLLALSYQGLGQQERSIRSFQQALQLSPSFVDARYHLAKAYQESGDFEKSKEQINFILKQQPNYLAAILLKSELLSRQGNTDEAKLLLEKTYLSGSKSKEIGISLINTLSHFFSTKQAYEFGKKLALDFPDDIDIQNQVSKLAFDQKDYHVAKQGYEQVLRLSPNDSVALQGIARTYLDMGRINQAIMIIHQLLEKNSQDKVALLLYADLAGKTQDLYQMNRALEWLAQIENNDADIYKKRGDLLLLTKQIEKAIEHYEKSYRIQPDLTIARTLYELKKISHPKQAISYIQDWVVSHPEDLNTQHFLAYLYLSDQPGKAIQLYQKILELSDDDPIALNNLALLLVDKNPPRSLSLITKGYHRHRNNPKILDTYGWVLFKNKKQEEALQYLKEAFEKEKDDPDIRWHYAYVLYHAGEINQAKEVLGDLLHDKIQQGTLPKEAKRFIFEIS